MLRGFNMELNKTSAQRVNDVYSNLAANAAANTHEIADAMTRTASIANAAGMEFETTAAFLTQMIETTRESAENLGTAMKTIVARFTEMKKAPGEIIEVDGEEVNVNKVEAALKSVGVQLRDTQGEFRNLDDVFLELASKWDSLDIMSQRYVATMAAGSRQQSRFIAMMSNYERTMELVTYATNSSGASQKQFEKTMDSLTSKLNRLHDAWEQFTTGIANQSIIKGIIDVLTDFLDTVNKVTDALDPLHTGWSKILALFLGFKAARGAVDKAFKLGKQVKVKNKTQLDADLGKEDGEKYSEGFWDSFIKKSKKKKREATEAAFGGEDQFSSKLSGMTPLDEAEKRSVEELTKENEELTEKIKELNAAKTKGENISEEAQAQNERTQAQIDRLNKKIEENTRLINENTGAKQQNNSTNIGGSDQSSASVVDGAEDAVEAAEDLGENLEDAAQSGARVVEQAENGAKGLSKMGKFASKFGQILGAIPGKIGLILAGVQLIMKIIKAIQGHFADTSETLKQRIERLTKTSEVLQQQISDTQSTISNLRTSWDELLSSKKTLNSLTEGTIEWKEQLIASNQLVLNLLDQIPRLSQYAYFDGKELKIDTTGYQKILNMQQKTLEQSQASNALTNALRASSQIERLQKETVVNSFTEGLAIQNQIDSEEIRMESQAQLGLNFGLQRYKTENGLKIEGPEQDFYERVLGKKTLAEYDKIKNEVEASAEEYAELTGLTVEQVKKKKEEGELTDDTIKSVIAYNKLYNEDIIPSVNKLRELYLDKDFKNNLVSRAVANELTSTDVNMDTSALSVLRENIDEGVQLEVEDLVSLGLNADYVRQLNQMGISIEQIAEYILDSYDRVQKEEEEINLLGKGSKDALTNFKNILSQKLGRELSTIESKGLTDMISQIDEQGGDVILFLENLQSAASQLKNPEEIQNFLKSLKSTDTSSTASLMSFFDALDNFGIKLDDNVKKQIIETSNAAKDFDMSKVRDELHETILTLSESVREKIKNDENKFSKAEYDDLIKQFPELEGSFVRRGTSYVYKGELDKLLKYLQKQDTNIREVQEIAARENKKKEENATKLQDAKNEIDEIEQKQGKRKVTGTKNLWTWAAEANETGATEIKNLGVFKKGTQTRVAVNELIDFSKIAQEKGVENKNGDGAKDIYLNSLIYELDDKGNPIIGKLDEHKITTIFEQIKKNEDLIGYLPSNIVSKIISELKGYYDKYTPNTQDEKAYFNRMIRLVLNSTDLSKEEDDFIEKYFTKDGAPDFRAISNVFTSEKADLGTSGISFTYEGLSDDDVLKILNNYANENFTKEDITKLAGLPIPQIMQKLDDKIAELDQEIDTTSLQKASSSAYENLEKARDIINLKPINSKMEEAQEDALDAIIRQHKGWKQQLIDIQKQYKITEKSAKKFLAIKYERMESVDSVIKILSDYKDAFDEEASPFVKTTENYKAGISELTEKFQELYGDEITTNWVERNIDIIRKLGSEENIAPVIKQLESKLSKVTLSKLQIDVEGIDFSGKIDENFYSSLEANFEKLSEEELGTSGAIEALEALKNKIDELKNSDIDIKVKANTLQAFGDLIKVGMVDALIRNDLEKFLTLRNLALSSGLNVSGMKKLLYAGANNGTITYSLKKNFSEDDIQSILSVGAPGYDFKVLPETIGSGINPDVEKEKEEKTTSDWTNDWNRQYDTLKRIEALERKRNELEKEHQRYVESNLLNEKQILKTKEDQRKNIMQQMQLNESLIQDAEAWLRGMSSDGQFDNAIWWDDNLKTIRTNDAYIRSMDEETKKKFDAISSDYEHYYSQRNTALENLSTLADTIDNLNNTITELNYHKNTENLIKAIDNVINLYDKAEARLEWTERNVTSKDIIDLYDAKGKELIEKSRVYTSDFIQTEAEINAMLNKSDYKKYYNYDWATGTVTRTNALDALVNEDIKNKVTKFINKLEELSVQRSEADNERNNIQDTLREMERSLLDKAEAFRQNVYDAIVQQKEEEINKLETINSSVQEAAADLVSSIQKNIQKIRQDRTNKKTEEELIKLQNRLNYLQMDTSGGNQKEILDLRKQLDEKEQSYTDTLIDQKISELQDQNTEAEKQRKQQIEVMKTQLEVQKDNGLIWSDVRYLIANGLSASGKIKEGSELDTALKSWGKYSSLSEQGKKDWSHEQNLGASNFNAYYSQGLNNRGYDQKVNYSANGADKSYDTIKQQMINAYKQGLIESINNTTPYRDYMRYDSKNNKLIQTKLFPHPNDDKALNSTLQNAWDQAWSTINTIYSLDSYFKTNSGKNIVFTQVPNIARYATGGLADYTGPAWLDGTPSSPELVLNQRDTKNFIQLKDILSSVMNDTSTQTKPNGDYYFEIEINVDKVTSDYDVDQIADRIKQQITNSAGYRNVNTINMIR